MKHIEQGGQHVMILSDAEYRALRFIAGNGTGDDPREVSMTRGGEKAIWERISQWAFNGTIPD